MNILSAVCMFGFLEDICKEKKEKGSTCISI